MMPHEVKSWHWFRPKSPSAWSWSSNEWTGPIPDTLLYNLGGGWVLVATLNNGQKIRVRSKCRS